MGLSARSFTESLERRYQFSLLSGSWPKTSATWKKLTSMLPLERSYRPNSMNMWTLSSVREPSWRPKCVQGCLWRSSQSFQRDTSLWLWWKIEMRSWRMLTNASIAQTSPTYRLSNAASARSSIAFGIMCTAAATCPMFKSSTDFPTRSSQPGKARSQPLWPKTSKWRVKNAHELTIAQLPETWEASLRLEPTESLWAEF